METKELRAAVAQSKTAGGRARFSPLLKRDLVRVSRQMRAAGQTHLSIAEALGISTQSVARFVNAPVDRERLRPVTTLDVRPGRVLRTPEGFEAKGLSVEEMASLVRALR